MENKQFYQAIAAAVLMLAAVGTLYWAFTRTDEVPLVLSKASLTGKVTYKGKPVPYALVIVSGESSSSTGQADAEGNYFVQYAPTGNVTIGVNTEAGRGMMRGAMMSAAMSGDRSKMPTFVTVPKKYFAPETSGITAEFPDKEGEIQYDIEL